MKKITLTKKEAQEFARRKLLIELAMKHEEIINTSREYDENFEKQIEAFEVGDYELHKALSDEEKRLNSKREILERELGIYMREDEENKFGIVFFDYEHSTLSNKKSFERQASL